MEHTNIPGSVYEHIDDEGHGQAFILQKQFEAQVNSRPSSIAVRCGDAALTYGELNRRANKLANHLRSLGVGSGKLVGLHTGRNMDVAVGIIGILKAGAGYLPLDPVYPGDRIAMMVEDADVSLIITDPDHAGGLHRCQVSLVLPDDWSGASVDTPDCVNTAGDLAYVIYTSGSTGKPKGVMISHRNVARLFESTADWYGFGPSDVWTMFHSYSFDFSVWEMWGALLHGGTVIVVPEALSRSTEEFRKLLVREKVTVLNQTPSAFRQLIKADMMEEPADYALRHVIFGGEALEFQSLRPWFDRYGDSGPQLVNMYGITETTVHVTYRPVTLADVDSGRGSVIGEPIPDLQLHILGEDLKPLPIGATGEMYVGGAGVAAGYLNRPELTAERFIPDPFEDGGRLYRTGDLARRTENGDVEYLGRIDHQVKIRGYRIELGEIESAIASWPDVREVAVIAREGDSGEKRLVAYVVAPDTSNLTDTLRAHLRPMLPHYMLPAHFMPLDKLPLTENGKLDRAALPAPEIVRGEIVAPSTPNEEIVAEVWGQVLGLDAVGIHENFFELGGHSLLVVDLIHRLRTRGLHIDAGSVFLEPTVAALAAAASDELAETVVPPNGIPDGSAEITPEMLPLVDLSSDEISEIIDAVPGGAANIQDIYPLTPLQEGMLYHHRMTGTGDIYLVTTLLSAETREPLERYADALGKVVQRHDILRSVYLWEGLSEPVQAVCRTVPLDVAVLDLDPALGDIAGQLLDRYDPKTFRIDVRTAPLIRLALAHDASNDRWLMLRVHHHLLEDHTADELMSEEIVAILDGREDTLPKALPFRDFVVRARQVAQSDAARDFFRDMLGDVDEPTLPYGFSDLVGEGSAIRESRQLLDADLARRLRAAALKAHVSAASLFHLAWATVIARCSGRDDVVFGTVLLGRMQTGADSGQVVGPFINTLPIRLGLGGASVAEAIRETHVRMAGLLRHEHASLAIAQGQSGVPSSGALFNALLNYRHLKIRGQESDSTNHAMETAIRNMGLNLVRFEERTNYPFELSVDDLGDGFMLEAQVRTPVDPADVCTYVETALEGLITAIDEAPETSMDAIKVLPEAERRRIVYDLNDTARAYDGDKSLHRLIEAQVARTPEAVALEFEGATLTFAEVNARANQLARLLRARGVGPEVLVGVFAERSFEMVIALVAILKAGGAYVPLDPAHPAQRLANVLEDAEAPVVLAQPAIADQLPESTAEVIALDPTWDAFASYDEGDLEELGGPGNLAYVIFTSGSTGRPKGAMNEHRGIVNRILWMQEEYDLTPNDRVVQKTPFSFDVSVWEFFWPLMTGARLVIAIPDGHRDSMYLARLIGEAGITTMHFVPSMLRIFLEERGLEDLTSLRQVMCSGEALPSDLVQRFFARLPNVQLHNLYGPTEAAVDVTHFACRRNDQGSTVPIGRPVANTQIHVLDTRMDPVPQGVAGEIFIGGIQVGRGYIRRDDLTQDRFVRDPFSDRADARLYKTGDLGRFLPDGTVEYLGRTDFQVKIRGQRLELGEIEATIDKHPNVGQSVVMARGEGVDANLVAYVVPHGERPATSDLRAHISALLPDYMVPPFFVFLEAFPLTSSGKVDRKKLPDPGDETEAAGYIAPRTPVESELAAIWSEVLKRERVGIRDNFFELGGHSLIAIGMIERMRRAGHNVDVRSLFATPTIAELAASIEEDSSLFDVPQNLIPKSCERITPDLLPLVDLEQSQIDAIVAKVPGGVANVKDIYPLAPLQEGFLFHHFLSTEGDLYVMVTQFEFVSRAQVDRYLEALQWVINRNDIMRSLFVWDGLDEPVQVVCREAPLLIEEVELDPADGDIAEQLRNKYNLLNYRFDMAIPPMIRVILAYDHAKDRWIFHQLTHHMMDDQASVNLQEAEIEAYLHGKGGDLPEPVQFRNYVAQARHGLPSSAYEEFFTDMLADVVEPTVPFGFVDVLGNGSEIDEGRKFIDPALSRRLFAASQRLGISTAALFHEAFALMLARISGHEEVVFGTVLLGRLIGGEGAGHIVGPCINTLPIRIAVGGASVEEGMRGTQKLLAQVLKHEHAPLTLAQKCAGTPGDVPVFTSIFNYRRPSQGTGIAGRNREGTADHATAQHSDTIEWFSENIPGRKFISFLERTNYPLTLSVDDFGDGFRLVSQVQAPIDPHLICGDMERALEDLVAALESPEATAFPQGWVVEPSAAKAATSDKPRSTDVAAKAAAIGERPKGEVEGAVHDIWCAILGLQEIGRDQDFFALGGHSILAIRIIWRIREKYEIALPVASIFQAPTIRRLAATIADQLISSDEPGTTVDVPQNLIPESCERITPDLLPLVDLEQSQIDAIVAKVPGGVANVKDIYPLAPLQEGFLFHHHLADEGDLYAVITQFAFASRELLDSYLAALQHVIDRNDILRTLFLSTDLEEPVQVVCREALLQVQEVTLDPADGDAADQLRNRFNLQTYRFDLEEPPLIRVFVAYDALKDRWIYHQLTHHLVIDHDSLSLQEAEIEAILLGRAEDLPEAIQFRNHVALTRLGTLQSDHEAFFRDMLGDVDEATLPFGFSDLLGNSAKVDESHRFIDDGLARRLVAAAKHQEVSAAALFHDAFAVVLARISGRADVVFGTVLLGRMSGGESAGRIFGPCINTLPIRIPTHDVSVKESVRDTQSLLARMLRHEQAPLGVALRCSGVQGDVPVFNSLLNYRRPIDGGDSAPETDTPGGLPVPAETAGRIQGRTFLGYVERTNYPLTLSVDDFGDRFRLDAQVQAPIDPERICGYVETALEELAAGLESAQDRLVDTIDILPAAERQTLLHDWQGAAASYPDGITLGQLFTQRAAEAPSATAILDDGRDWSYADVDSLADAIAARLAAAGVCPGDRVGLHLDRSAHLVAAMVACLKLGASFVPIGTNLPGSRIAYLVEDSGAKAVLTMQSHAQIFASPIALDTITDAEIVTAPARSPHPGAPEGAAYVIYTSGSTGKPKGVIGTHRATLNRFAWMWRTYPFEPGEMMCQKTAISFVDSIWEILGPLLAGVPQVVIPQETVSDPRQFLAMLERHGVTRLLVVPSLLKVLLDSGTDLASEAPSIRFLFTSGERLPADLGRRFLERNPHIRLINLYGSSEVAADVTVHEVAETDLEGSEIPIGRPIDNVRLYVLDDQRHPVPLGVSGEIWIGGHGLAAGYLGRDDLTAERFHPDSHSNEPGARMFATGDRGRYRTDGALIYEGRSDHQIKLRGYRVELGEVEAALAELPDIHEAVVILMGDGIDARLVGFVTQPPDTASDVSTVNLRRALADTLPDYMIPAHFQVLTSLPLNSSGKIDRRALPDLYDGTLALGPDGGEPANDTERRLLAVWQEVLRRPALAVTDNFFDAGGHSVMALQLFDSIRAEFGHDLPISTLFQHRTVRDLSPVLADLGDELPASDTNDAPAGLEGEWDTTAVIHPGPERGEKRPLFVVGGVGGNLNNLYELGSYLGEVRPLVGFQTRGVMGHTPHDSIEEMATENIRYMRQYQRHGPYVIGGYSGGAFAALEMVRQLEAEGEVVERLLVIDFHTPQFRRESAAVAMPPSQFVRRELRLLGRHGVGHLLRRVKLKLGAAAAEHSSLLDLLRDQGPGGHRYRILREAWWSAALAYEGGPINAPVTLFVADPNAHRKWFLDPTLGWKSVTPDNGFNYVEIGGEHLSLLTGEWAVALARALESQINASRVCPAAE